jgi:hypothetical protein
MVVHRSQIHRRLAGDHAHRRPVETMLHEQPLGGIEDAATGITSGLARGLGHGMPPCGDGCLRLTGTPGLAADSLKRLFESYIGLMACQRMPE